ncbi:AAA family ATPase [Streptomyces natalensis]|uniref:ABC transporter n=1 Tax=Streptomyces natalensis ATCC 27448 TaxID=1240678 RepID=A0A0D7CKJ0_9ACTN|nr:AAA family ATPase [Streptomyces natalensis]KIZ16724.1 ABC transporter [Streptomyces natalensis ATCC 27448]
MLIERAYADLPEGMGPAGEGWPWRVPCVRQLVEEGLAFRAPVTFLVGENGSGKSTLAEALAEGFGLDSYGGSAGYKYASSREASPLGRRMRFDPTREGRAMVRAPRIRRRGFFLRAETALEALSGERASQRISRHPGEMSHGEGFLLAFRERFSQRGLYVLDEPEAALSFTSCLELIALMDELGRAGAQVICATHSPLLTALPGAEIVEVGEHGMRSVKWAELGLVDHWRRYLSEPRAYLRHVLGQ